MPTPSPWEPQARKRKASKLGFWLWAGALAGVGLLLAALTTLFPGAISESTDKASLARMVAVFALVSSALLFIQRIDMKQTARNILLWTAVIGVLLVGYVYQTELQTAFTRVRSAIIPGYPIATAPGEMVLTEGEGGHYFVYGDVNGARVAFLIDTGATDIVLSPRDAIKAGLDMESLTFDRQTETANGKGLGASAMVDSLRIGNLTLRNVRVMVNKADMRSSLLGMTFLQRLKSFSFGDQRLTLRW